MKIKFYTHLSPSLIRKQQLFALENFFEEEGQELKFVLQNQLEKFSSKPSGWVFAIKDKNIIGQCLLFRRKLSNSSIVLGGLGEVCTHKKYRNQGIALKVLNESMKILNKWDCDVAYLNTDPKKLTGLYSKLGFTKLKNGAEFIGRSGVKYKEKNASLCSVSSMKVFQQLLKSNKPLFIGEGNW